MEPYGALYGRKCWTELGERQILDPELVSETEDKVRLIRDHLKVTFDRQKSYANMERRTIEYFVGDYVFLKVSPWKKVLRFLRKGKLNPRFIGPHQILKRVRLVAYQLELPSKLNCIHDVFHIEVRPNLTFEKEPVQILDRDVKILKRKSIPSVKVLSWNHGTKEATWEPQVSICQQYPHLFESGFVYVEEVFSKATFREYTGSLAVILRHRQVDATEVQR
ncbi:uncharacterized protein LOC105801176 [Gossypium raimondii]|uniref:uncharacterized protein LOC105801176 n=1 Tax=Gossypium raimondii TaxID=29730 RepID=UPI00063AAE77|nr:uncharacterized protein LOC105801176 [Gossypium raimondii]